MDYTNIQNQLKAYYSNTLIMQYHDKPKAIQTVELLVDLIYSNALLLQIQNGFNLESTTVNVYTFIPNSQPISERLSSVVVNKFIFEIMPDINKIEGYYYFYYDGNDWIFSNQAVTLSDYGITVVGTPILGDRFCIHYKPFTAVGKQLDIIGQWVGVSRNYNTNPITDKKLAYPQYSRLIPQATDAIQGGYSNYYTFNYDLSGKTITDAYIVDADNPFSASWLSLTDGGASLSPSDGEFYIIKTAGAYFDKIYCWVKDHYCLYDKGGQLTYNDLRSVDNKLSDDDYRVVIGLKIIYNSINHVAGEIDNAIWEYFGGKVYTTWTDHTIRYNYTSDLLELMQICLYKGVLPAPIGTEIQLIGV